MMTKRQIHIFLCISLLTLIVVGCGGGSSLQIPPPIPSDEQNIPEPENRRISNISDGFDKQFAGPLFRALDISRQLRKLTGNPIEAYDIDAFGEVPNSSWFTNRNGRETMTIDEIRRGPDSGDTPLMSEPSTIVAAKTEGVTPGFTIKDARGGRYIIKFDPKGWPELATGAEVVSTKLFYAAGYNTPENYLVTFDPQTLRLGENVMMLDRDRGVKRAMTQSDLDSLLAGIEKRPDGTIRAVASKFLPGKPIGPFKYYSTRKDDPNDFIPHEHRRELRGLYTIAGWLNHWDTKAGNSLDIYVNDSGTHYVRHYLIDFGSTLGSQGDEPMPIWVGHTNVVDPGQMVKNTVGLGLYVPGWQKGRSIEYESIGLFDTKDFNPDHFKTIVPNPAFVNQTHRDGFWGAQIVMSFTDEQIRSAVEAGEFSNPEAAEYLARVLIERRDVIGRYWTDKMNPAVDFSVEEAPNGSELHFADLAVERGYLQPADVRYQFEMKNDGEKMGSPGETNDAMRVPLPDIEEGTLEVRLRNRKADGNWGNWVSAFLATSKNPGGYTIVAIQRED